jgi:LysM repeat protein
MIRRLSLAVIISVVFISGCSRATPLVTPTITPTGLLTPFISQTPKPITPTATLLVQIPETPAPTPTPFLYTVKNDDTMLGIAYEFGISLQELQAANPTVDPHYMGPGLQLVIPIGGEIPENLPTATAYPVDLEQPLCYLAGDGGVWCVAAIHNSQTISLENMAVWIGLYDSHGENITSQVAYSPMNILGPDSTMPFMAYFSPPVPADLIARGEILSAIAVESGDPRYIDAQVELRDMVINPDHSQETVRGVVVLPEDTPAPSQVWVLAVAYNAEGNIIGERKWKSAGDTQFELTVYSLGGMIDQVKFLTEVRP